MHNSLFCWIRRTVEWDPPRRDANEQPLLDRAAYLQGYRGHVGDRDAVYRHVPTHLEVDS